MKRLFTLTLLLLLSLSLLLPTLTSCHGGRSLSAFEMPESFDSGKQYEINFWAKNETNDHQTAVYNDAISRFESLYPNIKVNLKIYNDYGRIYSDVITNIQTGTTPDVCITYPDHIATYITGSNIVVPLDELMTDEKYGLSGSELRFDGVGEDGIVEKFLNEGKIDGVQYALPYMRSTEACYINRNLVEALGYTVPDILTWDFIFEVSRAAMKKDADGLYVNGQTTMIPFIYKSTDNMMIQMLRQLGADYSTDGGEILLFNDDTAEILYAVADAAECGSFNTFKWVSYPGNYLNKGQCIFAIDSTAGATWMGSNAPQQDIDEENIVHFETLVRAVPQFDTENPKMISQGPSICIFNKEDEGQVLASWLFAQFLLTNEVQIAYSKTEGYVPVTTKAQSSKEYKDYLASAGASSDEGDEWIYYSVKHDAVRLLLDNIDNTFTTPVFNGSTSLRNAAGHLIEQTVISARRGEEIDGVFIDELYQDTEALYRLNQLTASADEKEFDSLPAISTALIVGFLAIWLGIAAYLVFTNIKKNKK